MRLPHESKESLNRAEKAWELLRPYGLTPENATLERHAVYTFQAGWATAWRRGRVLLAGDAAHLMPPFAGQGLGAGVRDVMNLGWKLDAVLRGAADEALLDTYGSERLPHAAAFVRFSMELGRIICISDAAEATARDARMIAEWSAGMQPPSPPRPRLGPGVHTGRAGGQLARQGRVGVRSGEPLLFDDLFGGPGALLARSTGLLADVPAAVRSALRDVGVDLVALSGEDGTGVPVVDDVDGTYASWLDALGADVVLVRPDFHVYGAGGERAAADLATGFLDRLGGLASVAGDAPGAPPDATPEES